ncbi:hypothetical protein [Halomicrobium urmianum]|uniref:hypothetical protein n=1 Tax=Halomicrobium urmianum TaxID=1586233 RepID=UPI001CD9CF1F|nr:hypothetical protein [Halomicrobium urmianum]
MSRESAAEGAASGPATALRHLALHPVEAVAFWAAVLLPLAYLALLYGGLGARELLLLAAALVLRAATLALGRGYDCDRA